MASWVATARTTTTNFRYTARGTRHAKIMVTFLFLNFCPHLHFIERGFKSGVAIIVDSTLKETGAGRLFDFRFSNRLDNGLFQNRVGTLTDS